MAKSTVGSAFLAVCLGAVLYAQTPPSGVEVLKKAQAAAQSSRLFSYVGDYRPSGYYARELPSVKGRVTVGKQSEWKLDRFVCDVKLQLPGDEDWLDYLIGSNGDRFFLFDHKAKLLREDMDPMIMGSLARHAQRIVLRDFAAPEPFRDDLLAKSITVEKSEVVDGEDCFVIHAAERPVLPHDMVWHISKKDFLPRRAERRFKRETEDATTVLTLTGLKVEPQAAVDPFVPVLPAGYTKTDKFPE